LKVSVPQGDPEAVESARKICEPARRGLVRPLRIVHREQQRPLTGNVDRQPVQAVQDGERPVTRIRARGVAEEQRPHGGRGPSEKYLLFVVTSKAALE
jgi:hypothetical protein